MYTHTYTYTRIFMYIQYVYLRMWTSPTSAVMSLLGITDASHVTIEAILEASPCPAGAAPIITSPDASAVASAHAHQKSGGAEGEEEAGPRMSGGAGGGGGSEAEGGEMLEMIDLEIEGSEVSVGNCYKVKDGLRRAGV